MKIKYLLLLIVILTLGCKEEFLLSSRNYEQLMVVEGFISNEPGPYTVKLYQSSQLNDPEVKPYQGCKVTVFDNTGYSEVLTEKEPGKFITAETGIQGIIGNKYSISIVSPDGKEYKTEFQEMIEAVEIDSVYADLIYQKKAEYPWGLPGYQFYVDTKVTLNQAYLLWNLEETYQYTADYPLYGIYDRGRVFVNNIDTITGYDTLYRCWKTQSVYSFYAGKTTNLTTPKITRQPLNFVSTESKRLTERYSLLLKQFTIGKEAYYFWKNIQDQASDENFLFAKQPFNIVGNVKNINNPSDPVLGYFTVGSVANKRIFINRPYVTFYYQLGNIATDLVNIFKKRGPFYLVSTDAGIGVVQKNCIDCTSEGGLPKRPTFWVGN